MRDLYQRGCSCRCAWTKGDVLIFALTLSDPDLDALLFFESLRFFAGQFRTRPTDLLAFPEHNISPHTANKRWCSSRALAYPSSSDQAFRACRTPGCGSHNKLDQRLGVGSQTVPNNFTSTITTGARLCRKKSKQKGRRGDFKKSSTRFPATWRVAGRRSLLTD